MSPKNRKKLYVLRNKLDRLDDGLIKLIKKRTNIIKNVLKLKTSKREIIDKKRISVILKSIKKKSIKNKIDIKLTQEIWKRMIFAYIDFEKRNFKKKITTYCVVEVFFLQTFHVFVLMEYIFLL